MNVARVVFLIGMGVTLIGFVITLMGCALLLWAEL